MTRLKLQERVARCIALERDIADAEKELKEHKALLIAEAEGEPEAHTPTDGGGWSWMFQDAVGNACRVTQPAAKLKGKIDGESKALIAIRELAGSAFNRLFLQVPAYRPIEKFRDEAVVLLGRDAKRLIKLTSTESAIQVGFEVKEPA